MRDVDAIKNAKRVTDGTDKVPKNIIINGGGGGNDNKEEKKKKKRSESIYIKSPSWT